MPNYAFLFGAGASYGSDTRGTPPLGDDLFDALQAFNPDGWGALSPDLANAFHGDFEAGMRHLSELHSHAMPPLQRAMAAYFFNFLPRTSNQYVALANKIRQGHWDGTLATLNYDRFLELSVGHVGLRPVVNTEPQKENDVEICLPHGCCHIFCEAVRGTAAGISMSGVGIQTDGPVEVIGDPVQFRQRIVSDAFPPVMSYFESQKRTLSGASFIRGQRERWRDIAEHASVIGLVGLRVRPHDNHIWDPLSSTSAKLVYCSGSRSGVEFEEWTADVRPGANDLMISSYFDDAFDQLCEELSLV
jgi:hypothetical protein